MLNKTNIYKSFLLLFLMLSSTFLAAENKSSGAESISSVPDSYLIGPGDLLNISVWKEPDMDLDVLVRPDGGITFPLVGEIIAGGLTTKQLSDEMVVKLKRYIPHPNVTVRVLQTPSNKVYVIGKVNRPGQFVATGYLDVLQALTMAGGLTPFADSEDIKIIRRTDTGTDVKLFDYDEVVAGERLDMNIILQPGDTVVVP
jgi:polysaccharide export outer membrane protein